MRFLQSHSFFGVAASYAQTPEVPHKMHFADMTLTIRDDARREIQKMWMHLHSIPAILISK